jgi:hypothetical protein
MCRFFRKSVAKKNRFNTYVIIQRSFLINNMEVELIHTQGMGLKAEVVLNGQKLVVMDSFSPPLAPMAPGNLKSPQFSANEFSDQSWEDMFSGNPDCAKRLEHIDGWKYIGYGEIVSLNPTILDLGGIQLEAGPNTHDQRCIGEYIMVIIDRLDLYADVER